MDRVQGVCTSKVLPRKKVYRDSGMYITKDETDPKSNESGRHKRQAPANRKDTKMRR